MAARSVAPCRPRKCIALEPGKHELPRQQKTLTWCGGCNPSLIVSPGGICALFVVVFPGRPELELRLKMAVVVRLHACMTGGGSGVDAAFGVPLPTSLASLSKAHRVTTSPALLEMGSSRCVEERALDLGRFQQAKEHCLRDNKTH